MCRESEQGGGADREGAAGMMDRGISVFHRLIVAGNAAPVSRFLEGRERDVRPVPSGTNCRTHAFPPHAIEEDEMRKYLFAAAMVTAIAAPAFADEVGVHVGPVGAGVTVGQSHEYSERDRDPNRTTVIKKEDEFGNRSKTVIHHDND